MKRLHLAIVGILYLGTGQATIPGNDPTDVSTTVPLVHYRSPFADYRPPGEDRTIAWKGANDTVGSIGGWRAYAREAAESAKTQAGGNKPAAPAVAPVLPPANPTPQPHKH